jgi:hypothetical protein
MPYILVHPLPPPYRNPYHPDLPTFTTSSRSIAHFFHSHGWRAKHIYAPPPELSSILPSATSTIPPIPSTPTQLSSSLQGAKALPTTKTAHTTAICCRSYTPSSLLTCSNITELHCYNILLDPAIFHGPPATPRQKQYLLYYAWGKLEVEDEEGNVDLWLPSEEVMKAGVVGIGEQKRKGKKGNGKKGGKGKRGKKGEGIEMDGEMSRQWEEAEKALLATGNLEWTEVGKKLRRTGELL